MKNSKFLSLNWLDLGKMFIIALVTFLLNFVQVELIPSLNVSPETRTLISGALAYLIKNFFTKPKKDTQATEEDSDLVGGRPGGR